MTTPSQRYATSSARFTALLDAVPDASLATPSPCEGWSVADVLAHVVSTETDFMVQRGVVVSGTDGLPSIAAWPLVRAAMQGALDDPAIAGATFDGYFGPTTVEGTVDRFYTLDLIGTGVFAASGAIAAGRKGLDLFGAAVIALAWELPSSPTQFVATTIMPRWSAM